MIRNGLFAGAVRADAAGTIFVDGTRLPRQGPAEGSAANSTGAVVRAARTLFPICELARTLTITNGRSAACAIGHVKWRIRARSDAARRIARLAIGGACRIATYAVDTESAQTCRIPGAGGAKCATTATRSIAKQIAIACRASRRRSMRGDCPIARVLGARIGVVVRIR
jgi:hypothetical protein